MPKTLPVVFIDEALLPESRQFSSPSPRWLSAVQHSCCYIQRHLDASKNQWFVELGLEIKESFGGRDDEANQLRLCKGMAAESRGPEACKEPSPPSFERTIETHRDASSPPCSWDIVRLSTWTNQKCITTNSLPNAGRTKLGTLE